MRRVRGLSIGRLEIIAFGTGFCLLAYELVAARLLAPYIGSSIYVWTSVIGVIILALSLGYGCGGWLADKRVRASDIAFLLLVAAGGVGATLIAYGAVLEAIVALIDDPRLQGLVASLLLFAPTSFVLGSISPYLARLKLRSISTTGRVVATLSAINSLGGIIGTLVTGFVLLGFMGSNQILGLLVVILAALSWVMTPSRFLPERIVITLAVLAATAYGLSPPLPRGVLANIDTPSSHYQVREIASSQGPLRILSTSPGVWQSGSFSNGSSELAFWYTQKMADIVDQAPRHNDILVLGGGAFSLPRYLSEKYPEAHITVVEIDPQLPDIAEKYFSYQPADNIEVVSEDARTFLEQNHHVYDVVVVDVFSDSAVPFTLTTKEYASSLQKATKPHGWVIVNLVVSAKGTCGELFGGIDASYRSAFSQAGYFEAQKSDFSLRQNVIAVYGDQPMTWLDHAPATSIKLVNTEAFTDNFSPSDRLNFECRLENT